VLTARGLHHPPTWLRPQAALGETNGIVPVTETELGAVSRPWRRRINALRLPAARVAQVCRIFSEAEYDQGREGDRSGSARQVARRSLTTLILRTRNQTRGRPVRHLEEPARRFRLRGTNLPKWK